MKKLFVLTVIFFIFAIYLFTGSCVRMTPNPCEGINLVVTTTVTNPSGNQSDGKITATAVGGSGFSFSINNRTFQNDGNFQNLAPGDYIVVVKNSNGCTSASEKIVFTNPCEGIPIALTINKSEPGHGLSNGSISVDATGGTGFTYKLNNGGFQASNVFSNLPAGTYTVVAKNSLGCLDSSKVDLIPSCASVTVTVTATKTDPSANQNNGVITAAATGGTGFTYSLNQGAYQNSNIFTNLAAGVYTVNAKNSNGCTGSSAVTLIDPCATPVVVTATSQTNPSPNASNGAITVSATGGTGFMYSRDGVNFQVTPTFTNLPAGTYTITARNSVGCRGFITVVLTNACAGVTVNVSFTKVDPIGPASNGSITVSATGGTGFQYNLNGGSYQPSSTFSNLGPGTYTITARSSQQCIGSVQVTLTDQCASRNIVVTGVVTSVVSCATPVANGSITINATGSTGFTYRLGTSGNYGPTNVFSNLAAGPYTIGVKDNIGCEKSAAVTVTTAPAGPLFQAVRQIVTSTKCLPCHNATRADGGVQFSTGDCGIVSLAAKIHNSVNVLLPGNSKYMPPVGSPQLTASEKQAIRDWFNAGGKHNQ